MTVIVSADFANLFIFGNHYGNDKRLAVHAYTLSMLYKYTLYGEVEIYIRYLLAFNKNNFCRDIHTRHTVDRFLIELYTLYIDTNGDKN